MADDDGLNFDFEEQLDVQPELLAEKVGPRYGKQDEDEQQGDVVAAGKNHRCSCIEALQHHAAAAVAAATFCLCMCPALVPCMFRVF
jgi:hypothetical protein